MLPRVMMLSLVMCVVCSCAVVGAEEKSATSPTPTGADPGSASSSLTNSGAYVPPVIHLIQPAPCALTALRLIQPNSVTMFEARLKLTPDQKAKVADLLKKAEEALKPKIELQRAAAGKFQDSLITKGATEATIIADGQAAMAAETALLVEKIKTLMALRALLTEDQNAELDKIFRQFGMPWRQAPPPGAQSSASPAQPTPSGLTETTTPR
jgi:Spy/CpxP family protein refolding chaperone